MMKLMSAMMPSCREVTGLLASGDVESASWLSRAKVRLHLAMCVHCSRFARQLRVISQAARAVWAPNSAGDTESLKRRILDRLRRPE
ncbi:MAG: hypothetical protein KGJ84_09700 [Elusimicrobia bacterium]|nr:hypothetical protein [Elusimicrobiota bacterium]